ncbi:MAG: cupin domain-containing protein [Candidatus Andersenbacteria bacterium]
MKKTVAPIAEPNITAEIIQQPEIVADDDRGVIEKLAAGNYQSVLRITSKRGTVRANHYHKRDSHLCYLVRGKIEYWHQLVDTPQAPLEKIIITPGQLFYTPPLVAHAMHFLEDSEFYCFTTQPRSQAAYEEDIVRVTVFVPPA